MTLTVHAVRARVPWEGTQGKPEISAKDEAPRREARYLCAREDCPFSPLSVPFAAEAEAPATWDCRCGATARLEGAPDAVAAPPVLPGLRSGSGRYDRVRDGKSPREHLHERRSEADGEAILSEALERARQTGAAR